MAKIRRLIPFSWTPTSWAMKGKTRQRAELEYYYEGEELERLLIGIDHKPNSQSYKIENWILDRNIGLIDEVEYEANVLSLDYEPGSPEYELRLLDIKRDLKLINDYDFEVSKLEIIHTPGSKEYQLEKLKIDEKHHKITPYDADAFRVHLLNSDEISQKKELLDVELKHGKIKQREYDKEVATLRGEPWVSVDGDFDPTKGPSGVMISIDYNDFFIKELIENGYEGRDEDQIIDIWFKAVCRVVAEEEGDTVYNNVTPIRRTPRDDGKAEYS